MLMTSSLASRNGFSGVSRSSGESVFGSVIASSEPCFLSLAALNPQIDLHPFVASERIKHPDHIELFLALWIVRRSDVHAVVKLLVIAQYLEEFGNERT